MAKDKGTNIAQESQLSLFDCVVVPKKSHDSGRVKENNTVCLASYRQMRALDVLSEELHKSGVLAVMGEA